MVKRLAFLLFPVFGLALPEARAGEQICRQYDVVNFVSQAIRQDYSYVRIDRNRIFERPAPASDSVLCYAEILRWDYDFTRYERMLWADTREYLVRKLAHGYEVTMLK